MSNVSNAQTNNVATFTIKNVSRKETRNLVSELLTVIVPTIRSNMDDFVLEIDGIEREIAATFKYILNQLGNAIYKQDIDTFLTVNGLLETTLTLLANENVLNKTMLKSSRMKINELLAQFLNPNVPEEKEEPTMNTKAKTTTRTPRSTKPVVADEVVNTKPVAQKVLPEVEKAVKAADAKIDTAVEIIESAKPQPVKRTPRTSTKAEAVAPTQTLTTEVAKEVVKDLKAATVNAKDVVNTSTTSEEIDDLEAKVLTADQELKALKKAEKKIKKAKAKIIEDRNEAAEKELKALKKAAGKLGVKIVVEGEKKESEESDTKSSKKTKVKKEKTLSTYEKCRQAGLGLGKDVFNAGKILTLDTARVLIGKKASFDTSKDKSEAMKTIEKANRAHATKVFYI